MHLRCDECSKKLKTFQALVSTLRNATGNDRQIPRKAAFFQDDKEVQLIAAQGLRSPAVRSEYKTWLTGVVDRLNGIHHYRQKSKFTQVTNG